MDPAAEALAGEPRKKPGAAMDAPDAAAWLADPTAHAAKPPTHNQRIIAALLAEIARGELATRAEIDAFTEREDEDPDQ
jgi:hypothetical protein